MVDHRSPMGLMPEVVDAVTKVLERHEWEAIVRFDVDEDTARVLTDYPNMRFHRGPWVLDNCAGFRVQCRHCRVHFPSAMACRP